jgi:L-alanine-DL-glutamate epimerase-like enolase superfamily enzyme
VKIYPFPQAGEVAPNRGRALTGGELDLAEARVRAVREAIGPDVALHTDWAWALSPGDVLAAAERMRPYDLFWIEEPFSADDPEELAALRRQIGPRLAGGEQLSEVQLSAVLGSFLRLEYGYAGVPWRDALVAGSETVEDGEIPLPTAPGLGIEWDGEAARAHQVS